MSEKLQKKIETNEEFQSIIEEIITNCKVEEMKNYYQHGLVTCYEHCYLSAYYCYLLCKKFNLDYVSATKGAMLHDLFLYDWHLKNERKGLHAFNHPKEALKNAQEQFEMTKVTEDVILNHMFPVTLRPPKTKEGLILTFVDKYSATTETLSSIKNKLSKNRALRFASFIVGIIIFKRPR